jgi:hypothetical protein
MRYLTIEDLQQMGVGATGYPGAARKSDVGLDTIDLSPAVVKANIALDNGAIIPAGTVVVTISEMWKPYAPSACFYPPQEHPPHEATRMCDVSYHLPGGDIISTAQVPEASLLRIQQGWNSEPPQPTQPQPQTQPTQPDQTTAPTPFASQDPSINPAAGLGPVSLPTSGGGAPQQQPQPPSIAEPQPPKKLWPKEDAGVATTDLMFRAAPDPKADFVQPEPNNFIPKGTEVALYADCEVWRGSGRGEQDADNIWCPVIYRNQKGWANGLYLQMRDGRRMACIMYPTAHLCPDTERRGLAEPIVLECDLRAGTRGVNIMWGSAWHGLLFIDKTWWVDDYSFSKHFPPEGTEHGYKLNISRSSGLVVQQSDDGQGMALAIVH